MDQVEKYLLYLTDSCHCHFILLGHIEREPDLVMGGNKIVIGTLGQKLSPKLPPMFSDVILSVREGDSWVWDTVDTRAVLKTRNLSYNGKLKQDFAPLFKSWEKNREAANHA